MASDRGRRSPEATGTRKPDAHPAVGIPAELGGPALRTDGIGDARYGPQGRPARQEHLRDCQLVSGLAGIYTYHYAGNPIDRADLRRMCDHLVGRDPDGLGEWYSPEERVGLGYCRLGVVDGAEDGAQPMVSADGQMAITFDGTI